MNKKLFFMCFAVIVFTQTFAQTQGIVIGSVSDNNSEKPLQGVSIKVKGTTIAQVTSENGSFVVQNVPEGNQVVVVAFQGYETQNIPVIVTKGEQIDLGIISLYVDLVREQNLSVISLSEEELSDDEGGADNTAGLLQASKDVFSSTAAYEFSATFFKPRGYDSANGKLLINGIEMNKVYNGRPQWSNWGGLNDMQRNQEISNGLAASDYTFGGIAGSTNILMRASAYQEGGRVSFASSNRSYTGRVMASYSSGLNENGWAYSVSFARRFAQEGFRDGTLYDANSFFASVERKFNDKHSLNLTTFYTPNRRGKSSGTTQEVYDLKGDTYNSYWGNQNGDIRNSRIKEIEEPVVMLNHYWTLSDKTTLNTNVAYQFGKTGNSRLDYGGTNLIYDINNNPFIVGGGSNPDPTYYQKLPSYFLRDIDSPDYANAYLAEQEFLNNGQVNWDAMYTANLTNGYSTYALYEDRNDDKQFTINSILNTNLKDNIKLNATVSYRKLTSENFANMLDLLGGNGYLDADSFSENINEAQNDLRNPNRIVQEGDKFKYNYTIDANILDAFAQAQFKYNKVDFYLAANVSNTNYQREGLFENGRFPGTASFGKSDKVDFTNFSTKAGATYKITGRHLLDFNVGYITQAPTIRNSFSNSRENNDIVKGLTEEKITAFDASYIFRTPIITGRLTGYYTAFTDATEISFYYADGISGITQNETSAFVQEVLSGIDKKNIGVELGLQAQVTPTIKLKGAASIGDYTYDNNPNLYLTSDDFDAPIDFGTSSLKDYHVAGGPQRAYSFGFEYRDPNYWWFGATTNYFSNGYVDISPLSRTSNFSTDPIDGLLFNDYDEEVARDLLVQEEFEDYVLVNAVGGKSWKINDYYLGFFASINNIFNTDYKTGGYEQSRNSNYRNLLEDKQRATPVFGNRYWKGYGTTYYLNVYLRF